MAFDASYTGNGVQTDFTVTFPYLDRTHVHATIAGSETTAFTWVNGVLIRFDAAPANGLAIRLYRSTPTTPLAEFTNGSPLLDRDLDTATLQSLYIIEENLPNYAEAGTILADAEAAQAASEAAATVAAGHATDASGSATAASTAQAAAETAETNAETAQAAAEAAAASVSTALDGLLPASSTDNALVRWDGTTGAAIQNSNVTLSDTGVLAPTANDGATLGSASLGWSDAFFASGGELNFDNGHLRLVDTTYGLGMAGTALGNNFAYIGYDANTFFRATQNVPAQDSITTRAVFGTANVTSGVGSFAHAGYFTISNGGTWTATGSVGQWGVIGFVGEAIGTRPDSRVWGGNLVAQANTAQASDLTGLEIDVKATDFDPLRRYGLQIIVMAGGDKGGTEVDTGIRMTNKPGGLGWTTGFEISNALGSGDFPIKSTGTVMKVTGGTIATGIDLSSSLTITGNAFVSPGFAVSGAGVVTSKGRTDGVAPSAGNVGEELKSEVAGGSAVSLSNGAAVNITSLAVTAGEWEIGGNIIANVSGGTLTFISGGPSIVSATAPTLPNGGAWWASGSSTTSGVGGSVGSRRYRFTAPTTVYLVSFANFSGTATAYGTLWARRVN